MDSSEHQRPTRVGGAGAVRGARDARDRRHGMGDATEMITIGFRFGGAVMIEIAV